MNLKNTLIFFASIALLIMWADQFLYKKVSFADSYFFLMFGIAGVLYVLYDRGQRILKEQEKKKGKKKN